MTKIVYNSCYGGFSLSHAAVMRYAEIKGITLYPDGDNYWHMPESERPAVLEGEAFYTAPFEARRASNEAYDLATLDPRRIPRSDSALVQVVEEMKEAADGTFAELAIEDVPAGTRYRIDAGG